jgi:cell division protease FtsH
MGDEIVYLGKPKDALDAIRTDLALRNRVERDLQDLQQRADGLVRRHRRAVIQVALALRDRRHLSGGAVREIFEASATAAAGKINN